jgi:hypothetical protein
MAVIRRKHEHNVIAPSTKIQHSTVTIIGILDVTLETEVPLFKIPVSELLR